MPKNVLALCILEGDIPELQQGRSAIRGGDRQRGGRAHGQGRQIGLQREDMRNAVPTGDSRLETGPKGRYLPQRIIKVARIHEVADQETNPEMAGTDQIDPIKEDHHLPSAGQQPVYGGKDTIGDAGPDGGFVVMPIGGFEAVAEIIAAVEGQYDLKIAEALLDLRTHRPGGLQAHGVLLFHPGGEQLCIDPHQQGGD